MVLAVAAVGVVLAWLPVRGGALSGPEEAAFLWMNGLPDVPYVLPWAAMQVGNVGASAGAALVALQRRAHRLALALACGGISTWMIAKLVKLFVERGRPAALLEETVRRHATLSGRGWVSGHAAVTAALVTIAWPALARPWRVLVIVAAAPMYVARVYVGEHLPLDMVGGALVGIVCGEAVVLLARAQWGGLAGDPFDKRRIPAS